MADPAWDDQDEQRRLELLRSLYDVEPLRDFTDRVNPKYAPAPPHLDRLFEVLERTRHEQVFAIVDLPPRHRKTTTCQNFIAWSLELDPAVKHAYVTYNEQKSRKESRRASRIAEQAGVPIDPARRAVLEWFTTADGSLRATSVNGGLTGEGVTGVLIIDDPVKDRKEADSAIRREDVWEWFCDVALTRMEPGSSIIIVMTRWHDDDLAGRILKGEFNEVLEAAGEEPWDWEHVHMPALCVDEQDGTGRTLGQALWPEAYDERYLAIRKAVNPWGFEALYQGNPRPREGRLFGSPMRYDLEALLDRGFDGCRIGLYVDPAASDSEKADHWACGVLVTAGYGAEMEGWLVDVEYFQADPITGAERVWEFQQRWGDIPIGIEGGTVGKAPIASLRRQQPELELYEIPTEGRSKWIRAQPAAAAWNQGRLLVPLRAPWVSRVVKQCQDFHGMDGGEDDLVDMISLGWNDMLDAPEPGDTDYGWQPSHMPAW